MPCSVYRITYESVQWCGYSVPWELSRHWPDAGIRAHVEPGPFQTGDRYFCGEAAGACAGLLFWLFLVCFF